MAAPKVRVDYEAMQQIAQAFGRESEAAERTLQNLQRSMDVLQRGDWIGKGAKAFYREMEQDVLPSMRRLTKALGSALGHVGDFFVGISEEGKDMVMGLVNLVTDPIGTAKGLGTGSPIPAS